MFEISKNSHDAERIAIVTAAWTKATASKDLDTILDLVTEDVTFLPPSGPPICGIDAVRQLYENWFRQFEIDQQPHIQEIVVCGDLAFSWGNEELTLTPSAGGNPIHMRGRGLTILRRGSDAKWRFARALNNLALVSR